MLLFGFSMVYKILIGNVRCRRFGFSIVHKIYNVEYEMLCKWDLEIRNGVSNGLLWIGFS